MSFHYNKYPLVSFCVWTGVCALVTSQTLKSLRAASGGAMEMHGWNPNKDDESQLARYEH